MAVLSEHVGNEPIIILRFALPADAAKDIEMVLSAVVDFKRAHPGKKVYRIIDIGQVTLPFSEMMVAMAAERGREGGANDPDVVTLFAGSHDMARLGVGALQQQEQYGKANAMLFPSEAEAIAFARSQMKA
jgi:hypothetical protein